MASTAAQWLQGRVPLRQRQQPTGPAAAPCTRSQPLTIAQAAPGVAKMPLPAMARFGLAGQRSSNCQSAVPSRRTQAPILDQAAAAVSRLPRPAAAGSGRLVLHRRASSRLVLVSAAREEGEDSPSKPASAVAEEDDGVSSSSDNGASSASSNGDTKPRAETSSNPKFDGKDEMEAAIRVQNLGRYELRKHINRLKKLNKLQAMVSVLEKSGMEDLAAYAKNRLDWLTRMEARQAERARARAQQAAESAANGSEGEYEPSGYFDPEMVRRRPETVRDPADSAAALRAANIHEQQMQVERAAMRLRDKGMEVILPVTKEEDDRSRDDGKDDSKDGGKVMDWGVLAGYDEQKRLIEDTVLMVLTNPEVFDKIAAQTRVAGQTAGCNRPRAVLFEGPPGTGKTTTARVIAQQGAVPLVNVHFEKILSKWYGEDERNLAEVLQICENFPRGCIIFLDELDSLMTSRSNSQQMHEVTRRMLGILLRHLDGFHADRRSVMIGATNRVADLDPALRSRFAVSVKFNLPDEDSRAAILGQYAKQLKPECLMMVAKNTPGMAGRDLRAICEDTERRWASDIIRNRVPEDALPSVLSYLTSAKQRLAQMQGGMDE